MAWADEEGLRGLVPREPGSPGRVPLARRWTLCILYPVSYLQTDC